MLRQRRRITLSDLRGRWIYIVLAAALAVGVLAVSGLTDRAAAAASAGVTIRASVADNETQAGADSREPAVSADGRFVVFVTLAALDPLDASDEGEGGFWDPDVYVRDTVTGTTVLVSHGYSADGVVQPSDLYEGGFNEAPSISADGRFIAFGTTASNIPRPLDPDSSPSTRVVVCDRDPDQDGAYARTCAYTMISRSPTSAGTEARTPMLSADATRIALMERTFGEGAPPARAAVADLPRAENGTLRAPEPTDFTSVPTAATVPGTGGTYNLFRHEEVVLSADGLHAIVVAQYLRPFGDGLFDRLTAVFGYRLADGASTRLDLGAAGTPIGNRDRSLAGVAVSGNGRRVAFAEENAPGQPASVVHAVDRDPDEDGAYGPDGGEPILSQVASRNTASVVVGGRSPAFSADGRYFAFATDAGGTHNGVDDTIRFESCIRRPPPILTINSYTAAELAAGPAAPGRAQPAPRGLAATHGPTHGPTQSPAPVPSSSSSSAPPVQTGTSYCDIAVRDLVVDRQREAANQPRLPAELASPSLRTACRAFTPGATCEGNGESDDPVLTADGSAVAFASAATDLVEGDTNSRRDVFVRRFLPELRADPLNFGAVQLDNATNRTAEIGHVGFGPLGIASVAITGPNAADFEVFPAETCTGAVLHASLQCLVSVRFRPREVGERSAVLEVRPRGGGTPLRVPLVGSGTERPISGNGFRAEPNPLDFGERRVLSTSDARAVTVTNAGTAPLRISSVRFEAAGANSFPGDYRIVANTCLAGNAPLVIPRGGTCQVTLSHNPQGSGSRPAVLVFDDPIGAPFPQMVAVRGGGAQPVLTASPPLARPGQVSQVKGSNFPANQSVTVKLDGMPGEIRCRSNSDGELVDADNRLWVALVVLPGTTPGGKDLRATVTSGLTPPNTVEAKVRYVVVPGSGTPRERDSTLRLRR